MQEVIVRKNKKCKEWRCTNKEKEQLAYRENKRETRIVRKTKESNYKELHNRLNTKEEKNEVYRLAKVRKN